MAFSCLDYPVSNLPQLTHVGELSAETSVTFDSHTHLGFEVHVIRRGHPDISMLSHRPQLHTGPDDVIIVPAGVPHHFRMQDASASVAWIGFQTARRVGIAESHMLHPALRRRSHTLTPAITYQEFNGALSALEVAGDALPRESITHIRHAPEIGVTVTEIVAEACAARAHADTRILGLLLSLVAQIQRRVESPVVHDAGDSPVARAIRYLSSRMANGVSLTEVAAAVGVTESHLSRAFYRSTGEHFAAYVNRHRVDLACDLMRQGLRTRDAARRLAFSSSSTFCRWFARNTGLTPRAYAAHVRSPASLESAASLEPTMSPASTAMAESLQQTDVAGNTPYRKIGI